jgi:hypothetical protein
MKISCDEATKICDQNQYKEASFLDKLKLSFHLFLCKKCGKYSHQNIVMTKCYEKHKLFATAKEDCLNEEEKKCMKEELKTKI